MKKQWADLLIKDYDYGKLKTSNPLAYLGYQAVKDQGVASYFKTHTTALGITNTDNADPKEEDYPLVSKIMKEAGIDPKSAKGTIMLGPEFAEGKNTYTLEHELMHRGMMELIKTGFKQTLDDHLIIQGNQHLHGSDGHSTELEADLMGNPLKPQYKNDEKAHKEFAEAFREDIDKIQALAKKLIKD